MSDVSSRTGPDTVTARPAGIGQAPVISLEVAGSVFTDWTGAQLERSLHELAGSFHFEYDDRYRTALLRPPLADRMKLTEITPQMPVLVRVDGEAVLRGHIEDVEWTVEGDQVSATLSGLDPGGDLLQCSANPEGPAEYRGLTVLQITQRLTAGFGITVRAEVDVGAPLDEFSVDVGETVFGAIDKACKQRAVLPTSDGLGGLVLTRSGFNRAPEALCIPGVMSVGMTLSARERFSDYWVKGQSRVHRGHGAAAPLTGTANPLASRPLAGSDTSQHSRRAATTPTPAAAPTTSSSTNRAAAILNVGHAKDPAVTRYRPKVWVARSGGGGAPHQVLAEWHMRVARARGDHRRYGVPDFRAGPDHRLWRPNEVVEIRVGDNDPYDMLIEGVRYCLDGSGGRTELVVVGPEAYDLEPLPDEHRRHRGTSVSQLPAIGGGSGGHR